MKHYFSITVDVDPPLPPDQDFIIEEGVTSFLDFFDKNDIKATFFVPGIVAKKFPTIMEEIVKRKHEVACHGFKHHPLEATLSVDKQVKLIRKATEIIEATIGQRPVGFRAPLFKINSNCWIALQRNNYVYDSSVVCSIFYGCFKSPIGTRPFHVNTKKCQKQSLLEIPVSTNIFPPLPLGGTWFRIFGLKWVEIGVKMNFIFRVPVVFYIHPKDLIRPKLIPGLHWYTYYNISNCMKMLSEMIKFVKREAAEFLRVSDLAKLQKRRHEDR